MATRDKVPCPVCGGDMQRTSQRCAECAYTVKSIRGDVIDRDLVGRFLGGEVLKFRMYRGQVRQFVDVVSGEL